MESEKTIKEETIWYYGKKSYFISPLLVRKKKFNGKKSRLSERNDDINEKSNQNSL